MNEIFLIYILLTSIFLLSGSLIILIQYLFNQLNKIKMYQKDIEDIKNSEPKFTQEKINESIEKQSGEIHEEVLKKEREAFRKIGEEFIEEFKKTLSTLQQDNINIFNNISKDIQSKAEEEIADFKNLLDKQTVNSEKIVGEKIETEYDQVRSEIEEYKKRELDKVRAGIDKIIEDVVTKTIGKSLDSQMHQEIIMDALREAVEENKATSV